MRVQRVVWVRRSRIANNDELIFMGLISFFSRPSQIELRASSVPRNVNMPNHENPVAIRNLAASALCWKEFMTKAADEPLAEGRNVGGKTGGLARPSVFRFRRAARAVESTIWKTATSF